MPTRPQTLRTRIAPTPSGYLHLGNALSFAITWALARQQQGTLILRIDDLDNARFRHKYLQDIFDTLQFMGLDYDEGPADAADFLKRYSQHLRLPRYHALLQQLAEKRLIYACSCSRKQLSTIKAKAGALHTCRHENLPLQMPDLAWRIRVPEATEVNFRDLLLQRCTVNLYKEMPDFVVRRKEGLPAYQIASLADDMEMGVNLVVRGEDLLTSTAAQLFMAKQLNAEAFMKTDFVHHPLLLEATGWKVSKSHGSLSVREMRKGGFNSKDLWRVLAQLVGWQDAGIEDAQSFLNRFRLQDLANLRQRALQAKTIK